MTTRSFCMGGVCLHITHDARATDLSFFDPFSVGGPTPSWPSFSLLVEARDPVRTRPMGAAGHSKAVRFAREAQTLRYVTTNVDATVRLGTRSARVTVGGPQALAGFLRFLLGLVLPQNEGLLLHAAGVVVDASSAAARGHVFMGPSGAGKSTIGLLATQRGATLLGDEIIALRVHDGQAWVYGTPLGSRGGHSGHPGAAPLTTLAWLRQGPTHAFHQGSIRDAVPRLLARTVALPEASDGEALLRAAQSIATHARCGELTFALDPDFWSVLTASR